MKPQPSAPLELAEIPANNPLAKSLRNAAAAHPDPEEAEALLKSAKKVEAADRKFKQASDDLTRSIERAKAKIEASERKRRLPGWVVALALVLVAATLGLLAFHYF